MLAIKPLPEFTDWLSGLKDGAVRGAVVARIKRLAMGLAVDVGPVGDGLSELRIHLGAGWRVCTSFSTVGPWSCCCAEEPSAPRPKISSVPRHWRRGWIDRWRRT